MRRIEQVNDLIRGEVGNIINRRIELPVGALVTVTRVVASADLHYADIFVSIMPALNEEKVLEIFSEKIAEIQHNLNRKLRMRPVPRIKFRVDADEKKRERIEALLARERLKEKE